MTSNSSGNDRARSPYRALPAPGKSQQHAPINTPVIIDGEEYVRRETVFPIPRQKRRRSVPMILLLTLLGGGIIVAEETAPFGLRPITAVGEAFGSFTRGAMSEFNRQEVCKQSAMNQLNLDQTAAQRKYDLDMSEWTARMNSATNRLSLEKAERAKYLGQCNLAALLDPELAKICMATVELRYGPSIAELEREISFIRRSRPESPEILSPNYQEHLEACRTIGSKEVG